MGRCWLSQLGPHYTRSRPPLPICQRDLLNRPSTQAPLSTRTRHPPGRSHFEAPQSGHLVVSTAAVVSPPLEPTVPVKQKARRISRVSTALLIGLGES